MDIQPTINKHKVERITLPIDGLTCWDGSALIVERVLLQVEGVRRAYINPVTEMAYVEYDPRRCNPEQLTTAIEQGDFHAGVPTRR